MSINETVSAETNEDLYFERMAAGLGDKLELIGRLGPRPADPKRPLRVLDFGCGGGELALGMALLAFADVLAVDEALPAVQRARAHLDEAIEAGAAPMMSVQHDHDGSLLDRLAPESFDAVVMSSVLHEAWSTAYTGALPVDADSSAEERAAASGIAWQELDRVVAAASRLIRPGGRLIVRDGVKPELPYTLAYADVADPALAALLDRWSDANPFGMGISRIEQSASLPPRFVGSSHDLAEAVLTCTWGEGSFARESRERYQLCTLGRFDQVVKEASGHLLVPLGSTSYVQPGYREHLDPVVSLSRWDASDDADAQAEPAPWFPDTNAVWAFEKF